MVILHNQQYFKQKSIIEKLTWKNMQEILYKIDYKSHFIKVPNLKLNWQENITKKKGNEICFELFYSSSKLRIK